MSTLNIILSVIGFVIVMFVSGIILINIESVNKRIQKKPVELFAGAFLVTSLFIMVLICLI